MARPSPGQSSDKENQPSSARDKGRTQQSHSDSRGAKRRRMQSQSNNEDYEELKFYNPAQDQAERQAIKKKSRALEREFNENKDVYLSRDNAGLHRTIDQANSIFESVKQTSDATLDSRLMVNVSDLAYKKSAQLVLGDTSTGVDVDEFVSKCISFMKNDRVDDGNTPGTSTQRRRRRSNRQEDDDEDEEREDILDWALLGTRACFPYNLRPPVPGFLLGPLSVQKKVRTQTQRRARQQKDSGQKEVRPEALTESDLQTSENNALTTLCQNIKERLNKHCASAAAAIESMGDLDDDEATTQMRRHRISATGGPSLFDFAINPHSFGQTVENLFYISFLIKEGNVGLEMDDDGLPTLLPATPQTVSEQRERGSKRHQAVFSIDYATWQTLIQAFEIKEPLIPTRETGQGNAAPGARGWYN